MNKKVSLTFAENLLLFMFLVASLFLLVVFLTSSTYLEAFLVASIVSVLIFCVK